MRPRVLALVFVVGLVLPASEARASAPAEIEAATRAGRAVFVVVTEAGASGTERALDVASRASALVERSTVVLLDRGAPENRELVARYRVLGAPVPLILVVASNGVVAGGALLRDATPEALANAVPTPKKAEMLLHLSQKVPVFVVVSGRRMVDERSAIFEACTAAAIRLEHKAATVIVDLEDEAEEAWREELKIAEREPAPVVVVFNAAGQKTAVFRGTVTADDLVAAATKKAACCPGGGC